MSSKIFLIIFFIIFLGIFLKQKVILDTFSNNSPINCKKYPYLCSDKTPEERRLQYKLASLAFPFSKDTKIPDTYYWASKT